MADAAAPDALRDERAASVAAFAAAALLAAASALAALAEAAAAFAREDGAAGLSLETGRDNAAARALYRAAGWHEDETQWYSLSFSKQHH